jgi:queuosine biosynthesis protein QueC
MKNYDLVILYSGGADSRLMVTFAEMMNKKFILLLIDYGQLHSDELKVAENHCRENRWNYKIIKTEIPVNSGLTGNGKKTNNKNVHEMHVPGRNSIFLSLAFSLAEYNKIPTIWIGCDWSDRLNLFPDCYQEYIIKINKVFKIAGPFEVKIECPLIGLTKDMVLGLLEYQNITDNLFSGYGDL